MVEMEPPLPAAAGPEARAAQYKSVLERLSLMLKMSRRITKERRVSGADLQATANIAELPDLLSLLTTADSHDLTPALLAAAGRTDRAGAGAVGALLGALACYGGLQACTAALAASSGADGSTPLHAAATCGNSAVVEVLLRAGAPVDAKNATGSTPLYRAAANNHLRAACALLAADANVGAKHAQGYTALHTAAGNGYVEMIDLLLRQGAPVGARAADGSTPLMVAAEAGCDPAVHRLLQAGADVTATDNKHESAATRAAKGGHTAVLEVLLNEMAALAGRLKRKVEDMERDSTCAVCMQRPRGVVLPDCGHLVLCATCAANVTRECPICRKKLTRRPLTVHMS